MYVIKILLTMVPMVNLLWIMYCVRCLVVDQTEISAAPSKKQKVH